MPRVNNSKNLSDYGRTRQWQLRKQYASILNDRIGYMENNGNVNTNNNLINNQGDYRDVNNYNYSENNYDADDDNDGSNYDYLDSINSSTESFDHLEFYNNNNNNNNNSNDNHIIFDNDDNDDDEERSDYGYLNDDSSNDESTQDSDYSEDHGIDGNVSAEDDRQQREEDVDEPLYAEADITTGEAMLAILTFVLKFNLSGTCLSEFLELIALLIPHTERFKRTPYKFHKFFENMKSPMVRHHYCSLCYSQLKNKNDRCNCADQANTSYFIEIPIIDQLQNLFLKPGFLEDLNFKFTRRTEPDYISDIYDGKIYKSYTGTNGLLADRNNLSFMFYVDGASSSKSSKCKIWPIYLVINELPYNKRILKENIIVSGLWFGPVDPIPSLFLQPLHSEMCKLRRGINFKIPGSNVPRKVKAIIIIGTCDTPAKADFMNHSHHNGFYGCPLCYSPSYNVEKTQIYPYEGALQLRTLEEHNQHAEDAYRSGNKVYGVKGPSILFKIMPDAINGMAIDIMHCVFLGVAKKLAFLWFDVSLRHEKFSLYDQKIVVDDRLKNIKPIMSVSRTPRSIIDDYSRWKANEWRNFFFLFSIPILHDIMDEKYLHHYMQLVMGISIISSNSISLEMLIRAEELLEAFVSNFQALYDCKFMSINIHLLRHLAESVRNIGPSWVTTCFPLEDLNGKLLKYINGTTHVGLQICSRVAYSIIMLTMVKNLDNDSIVKDYCSKNITTGKRLRNTHAIGERTYIVGKIHHSKDIPEFLRDSLVNSGFQLHPNFKLSIFRGIKKNGHLIYSSDYTRPHLYACSAISYQPHNSNGLKFGFVKSFFKICYCDQDCQPDECEAIFLAYIKKGVSSHLFRTSANDLLTYTHANNGDVNDQGQLSREDSQILISHLHLFQENRFTALEPISCIKSVCFTIEVENKIYIGELINNYELKGLD